MSGAESRPARRLRQPPTLTLTPPTKLLWQVGERPQASRDWLLDDDARDRGDHGEIEVDGDDAGGGVDGR